MSALTRWVCVDLRRRARSLVVLALLVAFATATVMTAVAGARRGGTAVERLLERTQPATIAVLPNEPEFDWGRVARLPGVEALARFPLSAFGVDDLPPYEATDFVYQDTEIMDAVERPVVLAGRLADPEFALDPVGEPLDIVVTQGRPAQGPDEITLAPASVEALGVAVGDRITLTGTDGDASLLLTGVAFVSSGSHNDYDEGAWVTRSAYDELFSGYNFTPPWWCCGPERTPRPSPPASGAPSSTCSATRRRRRTSAPSPARAGWRSWTRCSGYRSSWLRSSPCSPSVP